MMVLVSVAPELGQQLPVGLLPVALLRLQLQSSQRGPQPLPLSALLLAAASKQM